MSIFSLNKDSENQLSRLKVKKVFIIGGTGVVSDNVKSEIEGMGIETTRIYGQNRFETSIEVAENLKNVNGVVVTNGYGFPNYNLNLCTISLSFSASSA